METLYVAETTDPPDRVRFMTETIREVSLIEGLCLLLRRTRLLLSEENRIQILDALTEDLGAMNDEVKSRLPFPEEST
jgi:hypothetical protein